MCQIQHLTVCLTEPKQFFFLFFFLMPGLYQIFLVRYDQITKISSGNIDYKHVHISNTTHTIQSADTTIVIINMYKTAVVCIHITIHIYSLDVLRIFVNKS